jgi:hypothetical protein
MTVVWLTADLIDVKIARLPSFPYETQIALAAAFIAFTVTGRNAWSELPPLQRWSAVAGVASILSVVWFAITVAIVLQFHLFIGGPL